MQRDDRALFHRRVAFAAIAIGILGLGLSLAGLVQIQARHGRRFHTFCETYSPGYDPKGCSAKDMEAWTAAGATPAPGSGLPKP